MRRNWIVLLLIVLLVAVSVASTSFQKFDLLGFKRGTDAPLGMVMGLDIEGGSLVIFETEEPNPTLDQMSGLIANINRRVNAFGVTEAEVTLLGTNRVMVQMPGEHNVEQVKKSIGKVAKLDFRELARKEQPVPDAELDANGQPRTDESGSVIYKKDETGNIVYKRDESGNLVTQPTFSFEIAKGTVNDQQLTLDGSYLVANGAQVVQDTQTTGEFMVSLGFNDAGQQLLEQITTRNVDNLIGIFVDDVPVSTPVVKSPILAGQRGVIEGMSLTEARQLAIELNSGALPLSVRLVQETEINPTLGSAALEKGVVAGMIGLGLVLLFMVVYYRAVGVMAAIALCIYAVLMLAVFKLFPITLTLSGLAAFILSIGMAVDANVLIFERMREELRAGRSFATAIEVGFDRAWSAILDGNVTTLLVGVIMFVLASKMGGSASFIMGFAVTLFIGVVVSMFTAVVVTRLLLRLVAGTGLAHRVRFFNV